MAKRRKPRKKAAKRPAKVYGGGYCGVPETVERAFASDVTSGRASLIRRTNKKWVNGTTLHYYFFTSPARWRASNAEKKVVRDAFKRWKDVGIGLNFEEVTNADEAEIRIGFQSGDGAWSYVGRDVLEQGAGERTMNFGWDITQPGEIDTAIHEIGHTLGFPHEHQNPNAGIEWNEEKVYEELAKPPNNWSREQTHYNIIRKIEPDLVRGSNWDKDSIMHYPFEAGLINKPVKYRTQDLIPAPGLSGLDKKSVREFYPSLTKASHKELRPFRFVKLQLDPAEQANFNLVIPSSRNYTLSTFGQSDTVMVLFENVNGKLRYRTADDDSGYARNARIRTRLYPERKYVLRLRLYYGHRAGDFGVMMW